VNKTQIENFLAGPLVLIVILAVSTLLLRLVPDASAAHDAHIYALGACEGDGNGHMLADGGCIKQ
jgi:hypothetical protein